MYSSDGNRIGVLDVNDNPVEGAQVTITSSPVTVMTNASGYFSATVEVGSHNIVISMNSAEIYSSTFTCQKDTPHQMSDLHNQD